VRTLEATGSEGIAYLDYIEQKLILHNSHDTTTVNVQRAEPLKLEVEDFLKNIAEGTKPVVDGKEGLAILKIALEASTNNFALLTSP
jgi:UDP-N-acetylglucosamine 3-dehydrogenase